MPMKTQSVSRPTQSATRTPIEPRSTESTITHQPIDQSQDLHARISERAYALYEEHGREDGDAIEDWLEAERQVHNQGL